MPILRGLPDLTLLVREIREGLLTGYFVGGVLVGVVALLAAQSIFGRRCDRCGR